MATSCAVRHHYLFRIRWQVGNQPSKQQSRRKRACKLGDDEQRNICRSDTGKRIRQRTRDRHGWVCKGC